MIIQKIIIQKKRNLKENQDQQQRRKWEKKVSQVSLN
jgi:hypothetical protein